MKTKRWIMGFGMALFMVSTAFAQMGGCHMGGGHDTGGGMDTGGTHMDTHMGGGRGHGVHGAGGMVSGMMRNTVSHGYLDILNPITMPDEARGAIQAFIDASNSGLSISELWEYETVYKAELSDSTGEKAFDMLADKFTGRVGPEMGHSMMMNASYGRSLYKRPLFGKTLNITADQASVYAQDLVDQNNLGYALGTPEAYPGYYKFHTTESAGRFGMDIMVNGYNGRIWMNTILGAPIKKH